MFKAVFSRLLCVLTIVVSALAALSNALLLSCSNSDWRSYLIFFMDGFLSHFYFLLLLKFGIQIHFKLAEVTDQCVFVCSGLSPRRQVCDNRLSTGQHEELGNSDCESSAVEVHHDRGRNTFMRAKGRVASRTRPTAERAIPDSSPNP